MRTSLSTWMRETESWPSVYCANISQNDLTAFSCLRSSVRKPTGSFKKITHGPLRLEIEWGSCTEVGFLLGFSCTPDPSLHWPWWLLLPFSPRPLPSVPRHGTDLRTIGRQYCPDTAAPESMFTSILLSSSHKALCDTH